LRRERTCGLTGDTDFLGKLPSYCPPIGSSAEISAWALRIRNHRISVKRRKEESKRLEAENKEKREEFELDMRRVFGR
jgi:hypothetical protein